MEGELVRILHNVARAETYMRANFHLDPSNRLATTHQRYRQDRQTDSGHSIGRTVLQTVAQKVHAGFLRCRLDSLLYTIHGILHYCTILEVFVLRLWRWLRLLTPS